MAIEWRDLLHCAVCLRAFEEQAPSQQQGEALETGWRLPVSLLCGHTVCRSCLATTTSSVPAAAAAAGAGTTHPAPKLPASRTAAGNNHNSTLLHHSPRGKAAVAVAVAPSQQQQPEAHNEADGDNKGRAQQQQQRLPPDRRHTCPLDHTLHAIPLTQLPVNVALAHLLGLRVPTPLSVPHQVFLSAAAQEGDCSRTGTGTASDDESSGEAEGMPSDGAADSSHTANEMYQSALTALDALALLVSGGTPTIASPAGAPLRVPIYPVVNKALQRKMLTLMQCQILLPEGRHKLLRAARSICERIVTELIVMHQNTQQLTSHLWSAVRARGCQFLGPAMQEEVLKLVLLALETGSALSRKVLVMFIVQKLKPQYPQASKTSVGHVVQLLYRASCFKVSKRDGDSSLMELKEEFRNYDALRKEHDAQIIQIAMEAGLRIAPEQWSALLYGDHLHKSHMQSVIDKLQSAQFLASSVQELVIAVQRSGDPHKLGQLRSALDQLASLNMEDGGGSNHGNGNGEKSHGSGSEGECLELVAVTVQNLLQVVSGFLFFMANSLGKRDVLTANRQRPFEGPAMNMGMGGLQAGRGKPTFQASHRALSLSRSLPQSYSQPSFTNINNNPAMQQNMFHPMGDGAPSMNMHPLLFYSGPLERSAVNGVYGGPQVVNGAPAPSPSGSLSASAAYPRRSALAMSLSSSMNMSPALGAHHAPLAVDNHVYRPISRQASVPATMRTLERSPYQLDTHGFRSPGTLGSADYRFFDRGVSPATAGFTLGSDVENANGMHGGMGLQEDLYGAQSPRSLLAQHHVPTEYEGGGLDWASGSPANHLNDEDDALGMHDLQRGDAQTTFGPLLSHSRRMPSSSGNLLDEYARWRDDASTAQGIHRISSLSGELAGAGGSMRGSRSAVFHADYTPESYYYGNSPPFKPLSRLAQSTSCSSAPGHRQTNAPLEADREHDEVLSMRLCDEAGPDVPHALTAAGESDLPNGRRHNDKWAAACFFSLSDEEHSG